MIVAVDVDGVLCDLMKVWLDRYNKDYDDNLTNESLTGWEIIPFVKPECGVKILDYIEDPSIYDDAPIIKDALDGIEYIRSYGHRVVFVTASTIGHAGRKLTWLTDHKFLYDKKNYVEAFDKSLIEAKILIDDRYENVFSFQSGEKKIGYLFRQPWNKDYSFNEIVSWDRLIRDNSFEYLFTNLKE